MPSVPRVNRRGQAGQASCSFSVTPQTHTQPRLRAGAPTTSACAGTSRVTTAPAPTRQYGPRVRPHTTVAFAPRVAPRPTRVGRYSALREMNARGVFTLVNTAD